MFPPDNRIRDLDNYNKALFDALTNAGVWEDDRQVKRMLVEWGPVIPEGKVEITISKYEKTDLAVMCLLLATSGEVDLVIPQQQGFG